MRKVVLLRVGIDSGSGDMQGPLFEDGSFEFVPIPDKFHVNEKTYADRVGTKGMKLIEYFPRHLRERMVITPTHDDPEFESFTYGDPTTPKQRLKELEKGDLLVFYAGLEGYDFKSDPALYLIGFFVVEEAWVARELTPPKLQELFAKNFHVRHRETLLERDTRERNLVLVKGSQGSRLLTKAYPISEDRKDERGRLLKVLSTDMKEKVFGDLGGQNSLQRSNPRWVPPDFVSKAADFVLGLK